MKAAALIVAAGRGTRVGGGPKQYRLLGGKPVLRRTVEAFLRHPEIDTVRCVIHPDDASEYAAAVDGLVLLDPVAGGRSRQDSVRMGLESLEDIAPDIVLIHDAARPFVSAAVIDACLKGLDAAEGAIAAMQVHDTLKRGDKQGAIAATIDRTNLWRAQTPQAFRFDAILRAHRSALGHELTDDAAVAERAGLRVVLTPGSHENVKITTIADLVDAESRVSGVQRICRTGIGFDVHRLGPGDRVIICGVEIPHDGALVGHSDADVGLHAITDAVLGAIAAGDIGTHFPPSDHRWRGADSSVFARHAAELVHARGGRIENIDVTIICERPKIGPHRPAMVAKLADIFGLQVECVSVKATTTEGLGFTGRGQGIAAQAATSISFALSS